MRATGSVSQGGLLRSSFLAPSLANHVWTPFAGGWSAPNIPLGLPRLALLEQQGSNLRSSMGAYLLGTFLFPVFSILTSQIDLLETGTYIRDIVSSKVLYKYAGWKPASAGWICISDITR